jgi:hypothetical protein
MDWMTVINTAVGLTSIILGGFAIWLSLHLYTRSKDAERAVTNGLEAIKAQSEDLQRLTGRWMDRFTRHATEPRPADEGLMMLVSTVANLPSAILTQLSALPQTSAGPSQQALIQESIDGYIGLYYYSALANVLAQSQLPPEHEFDAQNQLHVGIQAIIDGSASDFQLMANALTRADPARVQSSSLQHLLNAAINQWRPHVRSSSQLFAFWRQQHPDQ